MATEQYLSLEDDTGKCSVGTDINSSGGFDCNICLDSVHDPVVTFCGHLYCWPCIYKWIQQQNMSPEEQIPQCPVCKANVSEKTLIPLYGRDESVKGSDDTVIPSRPKGPSSTMTNQQPSQHPHQHQHQHTYQQYNGSYSDLNTSAPATSLAGSTRFHPVISMFGEMICTRVFGNSQSFYTYPNSYNVAAMSSARARRHAMKVDRSLSRLSFFFLCCLVLCLVLF